MGARKFTPKQLRYLWAIGAFQRAPTRFTSRDHADSWASKHLPDPLTIENYSKLGESDKKQANVLDDYRGVSFGTINGELRRSSGKSASERMDRAFAHFAKPIPERVEAHRGFRGAFAEAAMRAFDEGRLREGSTITDFGFLSTSLSPTVVGKFQTYGETSGTMKIDVPKGTKAIYMGQRYEAEVLLDRGQQLRVKSVKKVPHKNMFGQESHSLELDVEVIR